MQILQTVSQRNIGVSRWTEKIYSREIGEINEKQEKDESEQMQSGDALAFSTADFLRNHIKQKSGARSVSNDSDESAQTNHDVSDNN